MLAVSSWLLTVAVLAQTARSDAYAVFVSQRAGVPELFALNIQTRQVSQLTETGRNHLIPAIAPGTRDVVFAAMAGGSYELFTAQVSPQWRSRRPALVGLQRLTVNTRDEVSPSLSATASLVAFASPDGVELMQAQSGARQIVLANDGVHRDYCPALSPDGTQIAFISNRGGEDELWLLTLNNGQTRRLATNAQPQGGLSWSADGRQLVFTTANTNTKLSGIALLTLDSGNWRLLTENSDSSPALSPSGDQLLFTSQRDGDPELYLLNLNTGVAERLTHSAGLDDGAVFVPAPALPRRSP